MSTFYGGEQFVDHLDVDVVTTITANYNDTLYTVPIGHYAIIRQATIIGTGGGTLFYSMLLEHWVKLAGGNQRDYLGETLAAPSVPLSDQLVNIDRRIHYNDQIRVLNVSNSNLGIARYTLHLDIYKLP